MIACLVTRQRPSFDSCSLKPSKYQQINLDSISSPDLMVPPSLQPRSQIANRANESTSPRPQNAHFTSPYLGPLTQLPFGVPTATMANALTPPAGIASLDFEDLGPMALLLTISFDESLSTERLLFAPPNPTFELQEAYGIDSPNSQEYFLFFSFLVDASCEFCRLSPRAILFPVFKHCQTQLPTKLNLIIIRFYTLRDLKFAFLLYTLKSLQDSQYGSPSQAFPPKCSAIRIQFPTGHNSTSHHRYATGFCRQERFWLHPMWQR